MKTGIPVDQIDNALSAFDLLFPITGGWFKEGNAQSYIKHLKMYPTPFMGIGSNYRSLVYGGEEGFDGLELSGTYTKNDLIAWNNLVVELLSK